MTKDIEIIRELHAAELDEVAGGLSIGTPIGSVSVNNDDGLANIQFQPADPAYPSASVNIG